MTSSILRRLLFCLVLLLGGTSHGGVTTYTDRGKADFDTVLQILNPYGTWSKVDNQWVYTPLDHQAPYTDGRWIYTEYGWYWKGNRPHSWATEHYGYWKRGADKVWSWYPGPYWLPQIVEIRATDKYIGWRCAAVDRDGSFVEEPADRYAKTDEWTFVTLEQFANPITPGIVAKPDVAKQQLEDSTECRHTYWTYRIIDRPGPHPADFADLCKDGGMLAPKTLEDKAAEQAPAPSLITPGVNIPDAAISTNAPATTAKVVTGTNAPTLIGADVNPAADKRQVKYWISMSLPTYWTPRPPEAKETEIYLYRPDFYQDEDGINRRITLWFNPKSRATLQELLGNGLPNTKPAAAGAPVAKASPAEPAVPAAPARKHDPFQSPFDDTYRPSPGEASHSTNASSKNPSAPTNTPANAPVPSPFINGTNSAPANSH